MAGKKKGKVTVTGVKLVKKRVSKAVKADRKKVHKHRHAKVVETRHHNVSHPMGMHQPMVQMPIGEYSGTGMQNGGFFPAAAAVYAGLKTLKPVGTIDNALNAFGVRDKVRDKLNKSKFGSFLVKGADYAKNQLGIGDDDVIKV